MVRYVIEEADGIAKLVCTRRCIDAFVEPAWPPGDGKHRWPAGSAPRRCKCCDQRLKVLARFNRAHCQDERPPQSIVGEQHLCADIVIGSKSRGDAQVNDTDPL